MPTGKAHNRSLGRLRRGFTLIELLTVLAIVAVLLTVVTPRYQRTLDRGKEKALMASLAGMRDAIDQYAADRGRYPDTLDDLVSARYLRAVPEDPMTGRRDTWRTTPPPEDSSTPGLVQDVHSGSNDSSRAGERYAQW